MSRWGRSQDMLDWVLWGYEKNQAGEWEPGALYDRGFTYKEVSDLEERILEAIVPIWTKPAPVAQSPPTLGSQPPEKEE